MRRLGRKTVKPPPLPPWPTASGDWRRRKRYRRPGPRNPYPQHESPAVLARRRMR